VGALTLAEFAARGVDINSSAPTPADTRRRYLDYATAAAVIATAAVLITSKLRPAAAA
jgi:hypothetical protein